MNTMRFQYGFIRRKILIFALAALPFFALAVIILFKSQIIAFMQAMPQCPFHRLTGYACPACGNTRSLLALLSFNFTAALRYNLTPPLLIVTAAMFYAELITLVCQKHVKIFPRGSLYWIIGIMLFYYIIRNFVPFLAV